MASYVQVSACKLCKKFVLKNNYHECQYSKSKLQLEQSLIPIKKTDDTIQMNNADDDENDDDNFEGLKKSDEFCEEDYSRLIEFIEPCRPIWDHKMNVSDRTENIKDQFWNQVFVQFEGKYSISTIKKSWSYMRQKYTREKLKPSGSEGKKKEWIHLKHLTFLESMIENKKRTSCNLANDDTILSTDSNVTQKNPKRKQSDSLNITHGLLKELKESRPIPPVQQNKEELDENDVFLKYLSVRMRGLPKESIIKLHDEFLSSVRREYSYYNG